MITKDDAGALVEEQVVREIFEDAQVSMPNVHFEYLS